MTPWIDWLWTVLVHATWIAALAGAFAWIGGVVASSARARHAWCVAGLLSLACGMAVTAVLTRPERSAAATTPPAALTAVAASQAIDPVSTPAAPAEVVADRAEAPVASTTSTAIDYRQPIVIAWLVGAALMLLRQGGLALRWQLARRRCQPLTGDWAERIAERCRQWRIRCPRLLLDARHAVPAIVGWWRPALIVPAGLLGLPREQLEALILHELAHLRRRDAWVEALLAAAECLLFWHPAVWFLARRLRSAREERCDGDALAAGAEPGALARGLLAVLEHLRTRPALAATGGEVASRIQRLLGGAPRRRRDGRGLLAVVALPLVVAVVSTVTMHAANAAEPEVPVVAQTEGEVGDDGTMSRYPLERRIAAWAAADGRIFVSRVTAIEAPERFWRQHDLTADRAQTITLPELEDLTAAAESDPDVLISASPTVASLPLQRAQVSHVRQFAYIADYERIGDPPQLDPVIDVLNYGEAVHASFEPAEGRVRLVEFRFNAINPIGVVRHRIEWPHPQRADETSVYPLEEPWIVTTASIGVEDSTVLSADQALAIPTRSWTHWESAEILDQLPPEALPEPEGSKSPYDVMVKAHQLLSAPERKERGGEPGRVMVFLTAELVASDDPRERLTIADDADWLAAQRVTCTAQDRPLIDVLTTLAAQTPVPWRLAVDADVRATRVSIDAEDRPLRAVLAELLPQTLLEIEAGAHQMTLRSMPDAITFDGTMGELATPEGRSVSDRALEPHEPPSWRTLPGAAWAEPVVRLYGVDDLLTQADHPLVHETAGWRCEARLPPDVFRFADRAAVAEALRTSVLPDTWGGDGAQRRDIALGTDHGGVLVSAAPAVHELVDTTLTDWCEQQQALEQGATVRFEMTAVRIDLDALDRRERRALRPLLAAPGIVELADMDLAEALAELDPAAIDRQPLPRTGILESMTLSCAGRGEGWWKDVELQVTPAVSADERWLEVSLRARLASESVEGVLQLAPGGGLAITGLGDGIVLVIERVAIEAPEAGVVDHGF